MKVTIDHANINDFLKIKFGDITIVIWEAGMLDKSVIDNFPNLQELYCSSNEITSLEPYLVVLI